MVSCRSRCHVGLQYEDEVAQAFALSLMPVKQMEAEAEDAASLSLQLGEERGVAVQDALVQELLAWFKSFFTWVRFSRNMLPQPVLILHAQSYPTKALLCDWKRRL